MLGLVVFCTLLGLGFCQTECNWETEQLCFAEWAPEGYCNVKEYTFENHHGIEVTCPAFCAVECDYETDKHCWGGVDHQTGCSMESTCQPYNVPVWHFWPRSEERMGDDILCENHCPEHCGPDEQVCSGGNDEYGCPLPEFCIPLTMNGTCGANSTNSNDDWNGEPRSLNSTEGCPMYCPPVCGAFEQECIGGADESGCPMPNFCAPLHYNNETWSSGFMRNDTDNQNGTVHCQLHCPKQCNWLNEMNCWGGLDKNGCPEPDYCMSLGYEVWSEENGTVYCPNHCSPMCGQDELWCSSGEQDNGCWGPMYCVPKTTIGPNGQECPGFCPQNCPPGAMYIPGQDDSNGCPTAGQCQFA